LGGGPAGLYSSISAKLRNPAHHVEVFERDRAGETFDRAVVLPDQALMNLSARARALGVVIHNKHEFDLIGATNGINSAVRTVHAERLS